MLTEISAPELGVEVALNWAAMQEHDNSNCIGLYNDTSYANGGYPTPFYYVVKDINLLARARHALARGSSSGSVVAATIPTRP
jgi:hypothetical protein